MAEEADSGWLPEYKADDVGARGLSDGLLALFPLEPEPEALPDPAPDPEPELKLLFTPSPVLPISGNGAVFGPGLVVNPPNPRVFRSSG